MNDLVKQLGSRPYYPQDKVRKALWLAPEVVAFDKDDEHLLELVVHTSVDFVSFQSDVLLRLVPGAEKDSFAVEYRETPHYKEVMPGFLRTAIMHFITTGSEGETQPVPGGMWLFCEEPTFFLYDMRNSLQQELKEIAITSRPPEQRENVGTCLFYKFVWFEPSLESEEPAQEGETDA